MRLLNLHDSRNTRMGKRSIAIHAHSISTGFHVHKILFDSMVGKTKDSYNLIRGPFYNIFFNHFEK